MKHVKYPRTFHLPMSPGATSDDKVLKSLDHFKGKVVVITEKMDGENFTLYRDHLHARSVDSKHHESRNWIKRFHPEFSYKILKGMRVCGENLYAQHSLHYSDLKSYFYGFSVWLNSTCLDWEHTLMWFEELGITPVPYLQLNGQEIKPHVFDLDLIHELSNTIDTTHHEGFVVRTEGAFEYDDFNTNVAKWVRRSHVSTSSHWMHQAVVPNGLKDKS